MAKTNNNDRKLWAILAYFIFFLPLLTEHKDDKFVRFHVGQGLVLLIASVVLWFLATFIPIIGWFIIGPIGSIVLFVCWIIGIVNAASDKEQPVPIVGTFAEKFKL